MLSADRLENLTDDPRDQLSMPIVLFLRCVSSGSHTFVFSSPTRPDDSGVQPQRSPPRLLTDAACGGLDAPPAWRTRRADLHHRHSTPRSNELLHRHHSTFKTHSGRSS